MRTEPTLEERLRDAYGTAADAWAPGTAPPLRARRRRGWAVRFAPVVAAVCVIALVIAAVVITRAHRSAHPVDPPSPTSTPASGRPQFTVHVVQPPAGGAAAIRVRDADTGALTGQIREPEGIDFDRIAAAGEAGTFVVSAWQGAGSSLRLSFHRLRLASDGRIAEFAALPGSSPTSERNSDVPLVVSRDGTRLAHVTYRPSSEGEGSRIDGIEVVSLTTGQRWSWSAQESSTVRSLSWSGSTLAFVYERSGPTSGGGQIRTLDTTVPGGDLLAGRVLLDLAPGDKGRVAWLNPDGSSLVTDSGAWPALSLYSTRTGRRIRTIYTPPQVPAGHEALWEGLVADASGGHLLAMPPSGPSVVHIDVAGGAYKVTPLPGVRDWEGDPAW